MTNLDSIHFIWKRLKLGIYKTKDYKNNNGMHLPCKLVGKLFMVKNNAISVVVVVVVSLVNQPLFNCVGEGKESLAKCNRTSCDNGMQKCLIVM